MTSHSIHPSVIIHPTAILEGDISIGAHTKIGPHCYLKGPLVIGERNEIAGNVMIGVDPEHKLKPPVGKVIIGNENVIREFSVIQRGIGDLDTQIHDRCYIMAYSYIAHDSLIESDVILSARVSLAGHCRILKGACLGVAASLHHLSTVGPHAFVGMGSIVVRDVQPFSMVIGNPARFLRFHQIPLELLKIKAEVLTIRDGNLNSNNSYVAKCVDDFLKHVRRPIMPINS